MEAPSFVRCGTRFQAVAAQGERSGALVFKEKLRRMIGQGCAVAASAEAPPEWLEDTVGPARDIYSGQASRWLMEAAAALLGARDLDWLYVSTTEVIPHKHAPTEARASEWVTALDEGIAALHEQATDIVITADHGMSGKRLCVDLERFLAESGYDATVVRLILDKHTFSHQNLGGAAYVYLTGDGYEAAERLADLDGVDLVSTLRRPPSASGCRATVSVI